MTYTLKHESPRHAVIVDENNEAHPWIATVNTENAPGRAEAVLAAIERAAACQSEPASNPAAVRDALPGGGATGANTTKD